MSSAQERLEESLDELSLITRSDVLRSYPEDVVARVQQRARAAVSAMQDYERRADRNTAIGACGGTVVVSVVQAFFTGPRHLLPGGIAGAAVLPLVFLLLWLIWEIADDDINYQRGRLVVSKQTREWATSRHPDLRQIWSIGRAIEKDKQNRPVLRRLLRDIILDITVPLLGLGLVLFLGVYAGLLPMFATLVAAVVCAFVGFQAGRLLVGRPDSVDPRDAVINVFVKVAARAVPQSPEERWRRQTDDWHKDTLSRAAFALSLERAGRDVGRLVLKLAPWSDELRRTLRGRAERIAGGFHQLAMAVTLGGSKRDERIAASLIAGLVAACTDDWEELTHAEPQSLRRRRPILGWIRRGAPRVALAGILAGAGVAVLLAMHESTTRQQIAFTLWAGALAALASPPKDAVGRVADEVQELGKGSGS